MATQAPRIFVIFVLKTSGYLLRITMSTSGLNETTTKWNRNLSQNTYNSHTV